MDVVNLSQLLGINGGSSHSSPLPTFMEPLAQAMELRDRFARLQLIREFQPGDIVREKPGLGIMKPDLRIVWIVIRRLTDSAYDNLLRQEFVRVGQIHNTAHWPDLVCGDMARTGGEQMALELISSALLEPINDAELRDWPLKAAI